MLHVFIDVNDNKNNLFLQRFRTWAYAKIACSTIWLMNTSTYAYYDNAEKWGIKKNI